MELWWLENSGLISNFCNIWVKQSKLLVIANVLLDGEERAGCFA